MSVRSTHSNEANLSLFGREDLRSSDCCPPYNQGARRSLPLHSPSLLTTIMAPTVNPKPGPHTSSHSSGTKSASNVPNTSSTTNVQAAISAVTLSQTDLEKIKVLDRSKNNWSIWSDKMQNYLLLKHGGAYILDITTCPNPILDPTGASLFDLNNLCIIAALRTHLSVEEQEFLRGHSNVHTAWEALKSCHEQVGPIAQILLIQQALSLCYRRHERLAGISTQLSALVRRIYTISLPAKDDFLVIIMLNTMSDELPHICNHVADTITISASTKAYGPSHIRSHLDVEQQLIDTESAKSSPDVVLVATKAMSSTCPTCCYKNTFLHPYYHFSSYALPSTLVPTRPPSTRTLLILLVLACTPCTPRASHASDASVTFIASFCASTCTTLWFTQTTLWLKDYIWCRISFYLFLCIYL
ncbi:hypothetical protein BDR07DRAFT_1490619 [Suillus spraguei]|nr:hypothetical protein BDR07DRAFT_1490619 [Suillus spraguei]